MARRILGSLCILLGGALLGIVLLVPLAQGETVSAAPIPCTPQGYIDRLGNQLCAEAFNTVGAPQTSGQTVTNTGGGPQTPGQVATNTGGGIPSAGQVPGNTGGGAPSPGIVTANTGGGAPSAGQVTAPILPKTGVAHRSGPESAQALGIALALLLVASGFVLLRRGRMMRAQA